ncbi:zinc-binding dehydrogenase [Saccharomonospora sp. NPDC006951]
MKIPTMNALRFDGSGAGIEQVRRARPAGGQVLVRVAAVAVGRVDGEPHAGLRPVRLNAEGRRTLGRHVAGTVAAPGAGVDAWPLGRPVVLQPEVSVRGGWFLPGVEHDGGLADYIAAPEQALVALPDELSLSDGAGLALAARAGSLLAHARLSPGESVGIWGAGAAGSCAVAVARALGAAPIVAVDPGHRARVTVRDLGADASFDPADPSLPERLRELTGRRGLDVALHLAPDPLAAEQVVAGLGPRGRGVLAGPAHRIGGLERWDGRTLSGVPPVAPDVLPLLVRLASRGRLRLPAFPALRGGQAEAAELLDSAVRGRSPAEPRLVTF